MCIFLQILETRDKPSVTFAKKQEQTYSFKKPSSDLVCPICLSFKINYFKRNQDINSYI